MAPAAAIRSIGGGERKGSHRSAGMESGQVEIGLSNDGLLAGSPDSFGYAVLVTYDTAVAELFHRFPDLRARYGAEFEHMGGEAPPYVVFGSLLLPYLESALERHDLRAILTTCAYLEDAAESSRKDSGLRELLRVEVGEWLGGMANEDLLAPWLGTETKKVCRYVPGLATQRREVRMRKEKLGRLSRIVSFVKKLFTP